MSSKTRGELSNSILHKTMKNTIKKGKNKNVKQIKAVAKSIVRNKLLRVKCKKPTDMKGQPSTIGYPDKDDDVLVKRKPKKKASPQKTKKKMCKKASRSVTAVVGKVCVVEGYNEQEFNNSWIDLDYVANDDGSQSCKKTPSANDVGSGCSIKMPSANDVHFLDVHDLIIDSTSKVGVVDLAFKTSTPIESTNNVGATSTPKLTAESRKRKRPKAKLKTMSSGKLKQVVKPSTGDDISKPPVNIMNYKFFSLDEDPSECLVLLPSASVLAFYGKALIKVLYGSANILGYHLTNTDGFIQAFSPQSHSALSITAGNFDENIGDLTKTLDALNFNDEAIKSEIKIGVCADNCCLLSMKRLQNGLTSYLTYFDQFEDIFNIKLPKNHLRTSNVDIAFGVGLQLMISDKDLETTFKAPDRYGEVCDIICCDLPHTTPVALVCGKKNVGKSTLCRYVMNAMLNKCSQVLYLECDIGQTEFTPPGFVSLTEVSQPIIGPPFCHQQKSKRMCYFGDINTRDSPDCYISCIKYLLEYYQQSHAQTPLVINTMGWTQDLGLMLLIDTIRLSKPTHIVQFIVPIQATPPLDAQYVESAEGWSVGLEDRGVGMDPQLLKVNVLLEHPTNQKYKGSDMRTLSILSTLFDLQPNPLPQNPEPLTAMVPIVLPWKRVAVCIPHYHIARAEVLYVLNASIVALCAADNHQVASSDNGDTLNVLSSLPVCESFGIGVIRGIDPVNELFYIISSVDDLHAVNLLISGAVPLPKQLIEQGQVGDIPYTKHHSTFRETGSAPLRKRTNIKRSKLRWRNRIGRK